MELDLQSLFGLHVYRQLFSLAETPYPPPPAFELIYEGAIGQPRWTTSLCDPLLSGQGLLECNTQILNMELDLQSLFGFHVHSCTHWLRPRTPPPRI
jgi:hypothetical protein